MPHSVSSTSKLVGMMISCSSYDWTSLRDTTHFLLSYIHFFINDSTLYLHNAQIVVNPTHYIHADYAPINNMPHYPPPGLYRGKGGAFDLF